MIHGQPVSFGGDPVVEQATPSISVSSAGLITASATQTAGYVEAGTKSATKQLTVQAAKTVTPTTSDQTAVAKDRYTTGAVTVKGDANLKAANIAKGVSIFGVAGSYVGEPVLLWENVVTQNATGRDAISSWNSNTASIAVADVSGYPAVIFETYPQNILDVGVTKAGFCLVKTDGTKSAIGGADDDASGYSRQVYFSSNTTLTTTYEGSWNCAVPYRMWGVKFTL